MIDELLKFLQKNDSEAIADWANSLQDKRHVRSALPHGDLLPLVREAYQWITTLIKINDKNKNTFTGFSCISYQKGSSIDTLLCLQTILLEGNRILSHLAASKIEDRSKFIVFFEKINDAFRHLISNATSYYRLKSISSLSNRFSTRSNRKDPNPSQLNLFYNAFQNSTDGIIITDLNGAIIEVNKAFLDIFGYTHNEVIGQTTSLLRSSHTTDALYDVMWKSINKTGSWKGEIINRKKDGEEIPILLSVTPLYENEQIVGYMGVQIDSSKQKRMEERLLQSERFAVIGKMASKVAHEIRNPLSSISLNAELLEDEIRAASASDCEDAKSLLQSIMNEVDRLTLLTEEYLQFSRLPQAVPEKADLVKIIKAVLGFFEAEANSLGIQILTSFIDQPPKLTFDPQQIRRLILNLLRNALEAMPGGGLIKISTQSNKEFVKLAISDTGHGIPKDKLDKIFEPFYTTKDMGTGLGLALCSQIMQEQGGKLEVRNNEKAGATFYAHFPIKRDKERLSDS